jgi:HAD superfamily hydrolase (TIGR01509 family)
LVEAGTSIWYKEPENFILWLFHKPIDIMVEIGKRGAVMSNQKEMSNLSDRNSKIKAIIFDLDGTLVDSEPIYFQSDRKLLAEYGVTNLDWELKTKYVGVGSREMLEDLHKVYQFKDTLENLLVKKNRYYLELAKDNTVVYPEMLRFVELLKANNFPIALASGSSPEAIELVLSVTDLKKHFDVILSAEHVKKGKPEPDIFLEAAKLLGIPAESCLVVEDSRYGVEAAKGALMYCMAMPYVTEETLHESFTKADLLFRNGITEFTAEKAFDWVTTLGR